MSAPVTAKAAPLLERPLDRVERVVWFALVDAWLQPGCPARCPEMPERAILRSQIQHVRALGLVQPIDGHCEAVRAESLLHRYDNAITCVAPLGPRMVLSVVAAIFLHALHDQPPTWNRLLDALSRVARKVTEVYDPRAASWDLARMSDDVDACRIAVELFDHIRDDDDEAFRAWVIDVAPRAK